MIAEVPTLLRALNAAFPLVKALNDKVAAPAVLEALSVAQDEKVQVCEKAAKNFAVQQSLAACLKEDAAVEAVAVLAPEPSDDAGGNDGLVTVAILDDVLGERQTELVMEALDHFAGKPESAPLFEFANGLASTNRIKMEELATSLRGLVEIRDPWANSLSDSRLSQPVLLSLPMTSLYSDY